MRSRRLTVVAVVALLACLAGQAPAQLSPPPAAPAGPTLRLGALLPLTGPGAWFGAEIKQGLDLAAAELDPGGRRGDATSGGGAAESRPPTAGSAESKTDTGSRPPAAAPAAETAPAAASPETTKAPSAPTSEPIEPADRPRTLTLVVQAVDVQPLDVRDAEAETNRMLGAGVNAILTASPTPDARRLSDRGRARRPRAPRGSRDRAVSRNEPQPVPAQALGGRPRRRPGRVCVGSAASGALGVLADSDGFGRAVRAAVAARWRQQGGHLAHDESVSLDASDLRSRLRAVARLAPEAVVLGFQGTALGEAARALRDAGYAGQLLAMDDDRAALLAGGRARSTAR